MPHQQPQLKPHESRVQLPEETTPDALDVVLEVAQEMGLYDGPGCDLATYIEIATGEHQPTMHRGQPTQAYQRLFRRWNLAITVAVRALAVGYRIHLDREGAVAEAERILGLAES